MEHNRCILCGRCERACGEIVANHTLGLRNRGNASMIHCDASLPGVSLPASPAALAFRSAPPAAISDKRSAFMGRDVQTESTKTTCNRCSIGCGMEVVTRAGNVLRIKSDWMQR